MMKTYRGERTFDGTVITVDGAPLDPRRSLKTYTLNAFEWGYEGPESLQLALAIVADAVGDDTAMAQAAAFMKAIVANFGNEWEITDEQVRSAVEALQDDAKARALSPH